MNERQRSFLAGMMLGAYIVGTFVGIALDADADAWLLIFPGLAALLALHLLTTEPKP